MPSPFPGMNSYLEQSDAWQDFHQNFITRAQELLARQVGPNDVVKIEVRLYLHELSEEERQFMGQADPGVSGGRRQTPKGRTATLEAPVVLRMPAVEVEKPSSLEIRDCRDRRLVTAIELLSPSNKTPGADRTDYLAKRSRVLAARANPIEIDLRRGGLRPEPPELPPCDSYVLVSRATDWPELGMWPVGLREHLPVVQVPLVPPGPDVPLDLQEVLHRAYDAADYGKYIYQETPEPPLSPEDAARARQFIPGRRRRPRSS